MKVNQEMLQFYWELGKDIVEKKAESRWGSGFMKNLSRDLKEVNPDATCFSETNLLYMKNFYLLYQPILQLLPNLGSKLLNRLLSKRRIVIEVKIGKFEFADIGQLGGYVVACNHILRKEGRDNPTIGLLICKEKDRVQAQYALESSSQPLAISEYELEKFYPEKVEGTIPTIEEIEAKLSERLEKKDGTL